MLLSIAVCRSKRWKAFKAQVKLLMDATSHHIEPYNLACDSDGAKAVALTRLLA
jgi:hypothetical protein